MTLPRKPTPRVVSQVCSLCGLDWDLHGTAPTAETCIKLLLDEVSSLNAQLATRPYSRPLPYVPVTPWPVTPWRPYWPTWYTTGINYSANSTVSPQPINYTQAALTSGSAPAI